MVFIFHVYCLVYNIAQILMVTYLGNEIYLTSNRLSYSLFESNWIDQPQITKKYVIIFAEIVKASQVLVIAKVYPLTLETFTKVCFKRKFSLETIVYIVCSVTVDFKL